MAPEVIKEQKCSEQSDIYALGMVIWEIAAKCTVPFKELNDASVMFKVVFNNEKEAIPSDAPQNIQHIIKGCWENNPSERISLVDVLATIENNRVDSQTKNLSEPNPKEINQQSYKSQQLDLQIPTEELSQLNLAENQQTAQIQQNIQPFKK